MLRRASPTCGSVFDIAAKEQRIREIETLTSDANFWNDPNRAQALMREMATLKASVDAHEQLSQRASDAAVMIELADESDDEAAARDAEGEVRALEAALERAERALMFSGKYDHADAILTIQPGAGGVDAQDWAEMLYHMYLRWAERHGFKVSEIEYTPAEVAGIKNVTLQIAGDCAYGYLRSERGVHRLVRYRRSTPATRARRRSPAWTCILTSKTTTSTSRSTRTTWR